MAHMEFTDNAKDYIENNSGDVQEALDDVLKKIDPDMKACIAFGCDIKFDYNGDKLRVSVNEPVSILKMPDGKPISVVRLNEKNI